MKDLLIGCVTNYKWEDIQNWVLSLDESGFSGDKLMLVYNVGFDLVEKLQEYNFDIIGFKRDNVNKKFIYDKPFNIVVSRFFDIWKILNKRTHYRYVITTDVKDVVFQSNPSEWIENNIQNKKILASSEALKYMHEDWGNNNMKLSFGEVIHQRMLEKEIYNAGVIAGESDYIRDLFLNIALLCKSAPLHVYGGGGPDQSAYNILLTLESYINIVKYVNHDDGWACQAGTTADPQKINYFRHNLLSSEPKFKNGKVLTNKDIPYCIVHQYNRVPLWNKFFNEKYGKLQ